MTAQHFLSVQRFGFIAAAAWALVGCTIGGTCPVGPGGNAKATGAPAVHIVAPMNGQAFKTTDTIAFQGTAVDPHDGSLTSNTALIWRADQSGDPSGEGPSDSLMASKLPVGQHVIHLTATDCEGLASTDSVTIMVN